MDEELRQKIKGLPYEEALQELDGWLSAHPADDDALTMRGMRYWGAGKRSLAINDFLAAVKINPERRAAQAIKSTE